MTYLPPVARMQRRLARQQDDLQDVMDSTPDDHVDPADVMQMQMRDKYIRQLEDKPWLVYE